MEKYIAKVDGLDQEEHQTTILLILLKVALVILILRYHQLFQNIGSDLTQKTGSLLSTILNTKI